MTIQKKKYSSGWNQLDFEGATRGLVQTKSDSCSRQFRQPVRGISRMEMRQVIIRKFGQRPALYRDDVRLLGCVCEQRNKILLLYE